MNYFKYENTATKKILNGTEVHPDDTPLGDGHPYLKFAYEVKFTTTGGEYGFDTAPVFLARTCELPRWTADTQVVNVYNHKTLVQTKLTYEPITMTFYDQANNAGDTMIWAWVQEQFDSTDGSKAAKFKSFEVEIKMKNLSAPGATDKIYKLKNAFIVDAQHDTLDYSSSDPIMWSLTIRYEDLETTGYEGPTPESNAGIKALPKPPEPVKTEGKKEQSSSFTPVTPSKTKTPITKPPKKDAVKAQEAPPEQPRWTDPIGTTDGAAIMDVAGTAPHKDIPWPSWMPFVGKKKAETPLRGGYETPPGYKVNGATSPTGHKWEPITHGTLTKNFSPSTGTNKVASPASPPTRQITSPGPTGTAPRSFSVSSLPSEYLQQQTNALNNAGYTPEYKTAYLRSLEENPPINDTPQARLTAEQRARLTALRDAPQYPSQNRVTDSGVYTDRSSMLARNPTNTVDDAKNVDIISTQLVRERELQKYVPTAKNRNDY